jgi:hypothetical protein
LLDVRYNQEGYLEIADGPLGPIDTRFNQVLTKAQVSELCVLYKSLAIDTPFNNLGETLEFIKYFKEQKGVNPELTLKQAFDSYNPDLPQIYDKYHTGTCILLSAKVCHEFAKKGIQAQMLSTMALNPWTSLPIPGREVEIPWDAFSQELKGVGHTDAVCFFKDEDGKENILRFRCSFDKGMPDEIIQYRPGQDKTALTKFTFEVGGSEIPDKVIDSGEIGKTWLKGRHKAVIKKDEMILGVDFLRGNIYFKPASGSEGRISIDMANLTNPEAKGIYLIDGVKAELSHREALRIMIEKAGREVYLPADTEENLISLAQNAPALMDDFFIQPLPLIKNVYQDLLVIDKKMEGLEGKMREEDLYLLQDKAIEVVRAIRLNEIDAAEKVRSFRAEIEKL